MRPVQVFSNKRDPENHGVDGAREGNQSVLIFNGFKHIGVIFGGIAISKTAMLTGTY